MCTVRQSFGRSTCTVRQSFGGSIYTLRPSFGGSMYTEAELWWIHVHCETELEVVGAASAFQLWFRLIHSGGDPGANFPMGCLQGGESHRSGETWLFFHHSSSSVSAYLGSSLS